MSLKVAVPGPLVVYGERSFVLRTGNKGDTRLPVIAAAWYGKGRVVAYGHGAFITQMEELNNGRFLANAVRWTARPTSLRVALVDPFNQRGAAVAVLAQLGIEVVKLSEADLLPALQRRAFDTLIVDAGVFDAQPERIRAADEFVRDGGGLVLDSLGWGWLLLHQGKSLQRDHGGNLLTRPMGIVWGDGTLAPPSPAGFASDGPEVLASSQADVALQTLGRISPSAAPLTDAAAIQASEVVTNAVIDVALGDPGYLKRVREFANSARGVVPSISTPVTRQQAAARLMFRLDAMDVQTPLEDPIRASPAAATFPGAVAANAPRVSRTLVINTTEQDWHGTGLYAPPGAAITVTSRASAASLTGAGVRIGSQTDTLWHMPQWQRAPDISVRKPLADGSVVVANPFGGTIYVDVPASAPKGFITVSIAGAVEAPVFKRGATTPKQWADMLSRPAPWAELEGRRIILTMPSSIARRIEDPDGLLAFWDQMVENTAELYGQSLDGRRPERFVFDAQISVGHMHAGYPIMATGYPGMPWQTIAERATRLRDKQDPDDDMAWGYFHETGHNFQRPWWTFDGAGEVTNNLAVLFNLERLHGQPIGRGIADLVPARRQKELVAYVKAGSPFATWNDRPFVALTMYAQLREAFGWDAYKKVFASYESDAVGNKSALPTTDDQKRDQWMVRFSTVVGRNLAPFFDAWGVPISPDARSLVARLPTWMPAEMTSAVAASASQ